MKRYLFLAFTLLIYRFLLAQEIQEINILYHEFDPTIHRSYVCNSSQMEEEIFIDLDQDGTTDMEFWLRVDYKYYTGMYIVFFPGPNFPNNDLFRITTQLDHTGDTLSTYPYYFTFLPEWYHTSGIRWVGIRWQREQGYCYGWIKFGLECSDISFNGFPRRIEFSIYELAYCTQPDYPFRVGQTSLDWTPVKEEDNLFVSVHPNPTDGRVTVSGMNINSVEVDNALGLPVASANAQSESIVVDLSGLPAGLYFLKVSDFDGRKCVKKVVKR